MKPALVQDTDYILEKTYHLAPYLGLLYASVHCGRRRLLVLGGKQASTIICFGLLLPLCNGGARLGNVGTRLGNGWARQTIVGVDQAMEGLD